MNGRLPPYSEKAEKSILGAIMVDPRTVVDICVDYKISPESFYVPAHMAIYEQMIKMVQRGEVVDLITLGESISKSGLLENVGGHMFLEKLMDALPSATHAEYYANIVREKHILRSVISVSTETIENCYSETDADAETILLESQSAMFGLSAASRLEQSQSIGEIALKVCDDWEEIAAGKKQFGLPPFLESMRLSFGNFIRGNPYFIAATPGGGKSVYLQNQCLFWAMQGKPVAIASLEMTKDKLISRMISELALVNSWQMYNGNHRTSPGVVSERIQSARCAARKLDGLPIHISDRPMNVDEFCAWGFRQADKNKIEAIAVDYLQILGPPAKLRLSGQEAVKYVCDQLQNFSKESGVITLVLSQITKLDFDAKGNARRPRKDDLYGGRIIDATSEGTLLLWQDSSGVDHIDIAKNRNGGEKLLDVDFDKTHNKFSDK